jgi:hypothetical protein
VDKVRAEGIPKKKKWRRRRWKVMTSLSSHPRQPKMVLHEETPSVD